MSHELPAAGNGFIWPQVVFSSDGEAVRVMCRASPILSREPIHYLSAFDVSIPARGFERGVDSFIDLVLRRLEGLRETELHVLWREVLAERGDAEQSVVRKLEARLGYDADEAPPYILEQLLTLATEAGEDVADEVAPVCAGSDPLGTLQEILGLASQAGTQAKVSIPPGPIPPNGTLAPWQRAKALASAVRQSLGLGAGPLDDRNLAGLLQISPNELKPNPGTGAPMGLAVRTGNGHLNLLFHKKNRAARRFEAARFIGDHLASEGRDRWLPVADTATARQKMQRAFAAEFLCPIASLRSYLGDEFLPESLEDAAEHFGISELAVKSHLANHQLIPRTLVGSDTSLWFPSGGPA